MNVDELSLREHRNSATSFRGKSSPDALSPFRECVNTPPEREKSVTYGSLFNF